MINWKFIFTASCTFIPYTILWFFWHNNMFHGVYYSTSAVYPIHIQNIWAMNFANALFVYGFVYFYFRAVKPDTKLINAILWAVYYNISVIGFFSFMAFGMIKERSFMLLLHDMIWAVIGGVFMGLLTFLLYKKIVK